MLGVIIFHVIVWIKVLYRFLLVMIMFYVGLQEHIADSRDH